MHSVRIQFAFSSHSVRIQFAFCLHSGDFLAPKSGEILLLLFSERRPQLAKLTLNPVMSFDPATLARIANLARLDIPVDQLSRFGAEMSSILALVDQLQGVDTKGVLPLSHPLSAVSEMALRLRPDEACADIDREANMQNAPVTENGLFLVPKVLE